MITIHFDFTDGTELSYIKGFELGDNFTTCCLDFFSFDTNVDDVIVLCNDGSKISRNELLLNDGRYTDKQIRKSHNIHRMLVAGSFKFVLINNDTI